MVRRLVLFFVLTIILTGLSYFLLDIIDAHRSRLLILIVAILIITVILLMFNQYYRITNMPGDKK